MGLWILLEAITHFLVPEGHIPEKRPYFSPGLRFKSLAWPEIPSVNQPKIRAIHPGRLFLQPAVPVPLRLMCVSCVPVFENNRISDILKLERETTMLESIR